MFHVKQSLISDSKLVCICCFLMFLQIEFSFIHIQKVSRETNILIANLFILIILYF